MRRKKQLIFSPRDERRERSGLVCCDWCRFVDVFFRVYDRVVEQQYSFEKKEQGALREMATRRSYFTTTGGRQQIGLRRRRSNRGVGVRNNNININKMCFESSTTTETSSNYEEEDNERKKLTWQLLARGLRGYRARIT